MAESSGTAVSGPPGSDTYAATRDGPTPRQNRLFFALTLGVFLLTRLWGLDRFPIYFFCDEAVLAVPSIGGPVSKRRISVRDVNAGEPEHVHLREIRVREAPAATIARSPTDSRT
jgi:hypothetical protein